MNILQRALKFMAGGQETKQAKFPLLWPNFRMGQPQWQLIDLQAYINEGFNLNTLVYSAIMYKVRALRSTTLRAYTGDPEHPELLDSTHPLAQLVARPNPSMSWQTFQGLNTVYLNVAGNAYVWLQRPRGGGLPETMYSMRPDRVFIIPQPDRKSVLGYIYVPEGMSYRDGVPIVPQDMIHVKLPNPGDPLDGLGYGLSPCSSAARSIDVDNDITHFLKLFFKSGTMVTGLLQFDAPLDDTIMARVKARWKEINSGYENWDIGVLDSGGQYQRVGLTFDEMGFETLDDRNESRIVAPFGVPGILIGTRFGMKRGTFSNYAEARRACWEDTLVPENALFEDAYSYYLQTDDGGFVRFDYSKVAALKQDVAPMVAAAYQLWQMGTPANMATATVGLDMPDIPGGDIGYLPLSAVPVSVDRAPAATDVGTPEAEQQADEQQGKARKQDAHDAMIACYIGDDFGIGNVPKNERHMTLAYIHDTTKIDKAELLEKLELFSGSHAALSGTCNAVTVFENGAERSMVAIVDSRQLPYWRNNLIDDTGLKNLIDDQHGYIPHVTLSKLKPGEAVPDTAGVIGKEIEFSGITLAWNEDKTRYEFHLDGIITALPGDRKQGKAQAR